MTLKLAAAVLLLFPAAVAGGQNLSLETNSQIAERIRTLAETAGSYDEQVELTWLLVTRTVNGDEAAHRLARPHAERLKSLDALSYRAHFAFGFCRGKEAFETRDPVLKRRRIDEARRAMTTAQEIGARDPKFLMESGVAQASLPTEIDLHRQSVNALTVARREMGNRFAELPAVRRCEWYWAMGTGFARSGLDEPARDHFRIAYEIAPDSLFGRLAINWVRAKGG